MERPVSGGSGLALPRLWVPALVLCFAIAGTSAAQEGADAGEDAAERNLDSEHCVRINDIDRIDIVDADTLVFRLRGGKVYRNELPHRCPGLRSNKTLMYRTSVGSLCSIDVVTVLEDWGFGFAPGASCGLGMFDPITAQIADEMLRAGE